MTAERYFWVGLAGGTIMFVGVLTTNWLLYVVGAAVAVPSGILGYRAMDRD